MPKRTGTIEIEGVGVVQVAASPRRKTIEVSWCAGKFHALIPSCYSEEECRDDIAALIARLASRTGGATMTDQDLAERAEKLAKRYRLPHAAQITWFEGKRSFWGKCWPDERRIIIGESVKTMPGWVLDYLIVHELSHIAHPEHSPAFWRTVRRYKRTDRAIGYLDAMATMGV